MKGYNSDEHLSSAEEARFAALPRTMTGDDMAETRTVNALHSRGLLHKSRARFGVPLVISGAVAAGLLLFVAGVAVGRSVEQSSSSAGSSAVSEVQRTGSAFVEALVRLAESASVDSSANLAEGLEVGTTTLRAAAANAARIAPQNAKLTRIRDGLDIAADFAADAPIRGQGLVWY